MSFIIGFYFARGVGPWGIFAGRSSAENALLAMPPRQPNENFQEAYEVELILDDRQNFWFV
jgi:hypothetical protein